MNDVDFEKVRDTAIAMITSALYASELTDEEDRIKELAIGMRFALPEDMTAGELYSVPSVLVQIAESFIRLLAETVGMEVMDLWSNAVEEIRGIPLVGEEEI